MQGFTPIRHKTAFTLAEVLITIGIVGIVAAMTLPALIQKRQNKVLETQFKKSYAMLSQVLISVVANEYGSIADIDWAEFSSFVSYAADYYKEASASWPSLTEYPNGTPTQRSTFMKKYYQNYTGGNTSGRFNDGIINVLDGSTIFFDREAAATDDYYTSDYILIALDANGYRNKPNRFGYDTFAFQLEKDGKLVPMGKEDTFFPEDTYCSASSSDSENGYGCTRKALSDPNYFNDL